MVEEHQLSERRACSLVGLSRDSYRNPPQPDQLTVNAGRNFPTLAGRIFPHPWEFWAVSPALKTGTPF
jgi:hypothetical protein